MRRKLIAANWKMHLPPLSFAELRRGKPSSGLTPYHPQAAVDVVVFPSFLHIPQCIQAKLAVGGQCGRPEPEGAFTGDVSMKILKDMGCTHVLCGHSERRREYGETDAFIAEQVVAALECGLHPILCIGETKKERDASKAHAVIKKQLRLLTANYQLLTIAYEPIWAIGTGANALPDDAQEMHAFIRSLLHKDTKESTRIIYGGSVTDLNAADFLAHPDIDGLLVGSASLEPEKFSTIVESAIVAA